MKQTSILVCHCTVRALDLALHESDIDGNILAPVQEVSAAILGDIDADKDVGIFSIVTIAGAYGSQEGQLECARATNLTRFLVLEMEL